MKSKFFRILGVVTTVAMLVGMLAIAPVAGLSVPTVGVTPTTISAAATYTIVFQITSALAAGDLIEITFPTGTNALTATASIGASSGIGTAAYAVAPAATTHPGASTTVLRAALNAATGVGATLQVDVAGVTNPATAGNYTLSVSTKTAAFVVVEPAVTSGAYTIGVPVVLPTPGVVKLYNSANVLMDQQVGQNKIAALVAAAGVNYTVELGPGLYDETAAITIAVEGLTIKASGALADTVVPLDWTVNAKNVTFKGLTMKSLTPGGVVITVGVTGDNITIDGCAFVKSGTAVTAASQALIVVDNTTTAGKIQNCTFDTTLGNVQDYAIVGTLAAIGVTISKNTFTVDADLVIPPNEDNAVHADGTATISENTFKGPSGIGVIVAAAGKTVTVSKNNFSDLTRALYVSAGTVDFTENTVTGCGQAVSTTYTAGAGSIYVSAATRVSIVANKITGSKATIAGVANSATAAVTYINFNDLSGNTLGIIHMSGALHTADLDATHNWWGVASGPTATQQTYYTSAALGVDASYYLGSAPSNAKLAFKTNVLDAKSTASIVVNLLAGGAAAVINDDADRIGIANYATNPGAVAPPSTLKVVKYYDVYVVDADADANIARLFFYGTINDFSEVWYYNAFSGAWAKVPTQSANVGAGCVIADVYTIDLLGRPFVLVEAPPAAPGSTAVTQTPVLGAVNVPVDTTFTWPAVTGAVSYVFELAEETGQTDKFYLKDEVGGPTVNAYKLVDDLKYDTQYWWRVQAINSLGVKSAWTTSFFTTAKEVVVVEPLPPVIVQENPPAQITLEIPPDEEVVVEPIPSYLLWAVIAVGALLVIVVIVLIVRTRRIS